MQVPTTALEFAYDGKQSHFRAGDAIRMAFETIRNPVSGTEHRVAVDLPTRLIAKREEHFSSKTL
jgi:hypothetical protein